MNFLLRLLSPAAHIEPIRDKEAVDQNYKYWRYRILYSMFVGYALFYFTRKSFTFAMPGMIEDLHLDKAQLGLLGSIFYITYGVSKFASGIISDRSNPRYFMAIGLMLTGVCNLLFGLSSSLLVFALFWGMNGWFQGFGWPPCARLLTHWYSHSERGSWWSTWNVSHNVGAFLIPWIVGAAMYYFGWRYAMYIPGWICLFGGLFLINRLRDTPQSLGLPPIEQYRDDYVGSTLKKGEVEEELSTREILFDYVLKNKYMWMLGLAYFFVYVVRTGINDWTVLFLREEKGYELLAANGCVSLFEVGGFFGSLCAGWFSDRFFGAKRGPVNVIFALGMLLAILGFYLTPAGHPYLDSLGLFLIGFVIFGPQMLIGVAAAELSHKKAAATSTGFTGFIAYIGAASAGYPLGKIADIIGWEGFFLVLIACCILSVLFLVPMWGITENKKKSKPIRKPTVGKEVAVDG
jgi:MFS transporter, OPA family, sugar phosphate sensor protein UhpC